LWGGGSPGKAGWLSRGCYSVQHAWMLVPEPQNKWEASTWILAATADAYFLSGFNTSALEALQYAMTCPGGVGLGGAILDG
jgi:hypothetical protein